MCCKKVVSGCSRLPQPSGCKWCCVGGLLTQNIMDEWLTCQGKWLYLEPIFSADEIMKQIPREGSAFRLMDASWRQIVQQVSTAAYWGLQAATGCWPQAWGPTEWSLHDVHLIKQLYLSLQAATDLLCCRSMSSP